MIRALVRLALAPVLLALTACGMGDATAGTGPGVETLWARDLANQVSTGNVILVDVRTPAEYAGGHIEGAVNMPIGSMEPSVVDTLEGEPVFYCHSGGRSEKAATKYAEHTGEPARHLEGGILAWEEENLPVVTAQDADPDADS